MSDEEKYYNLVEDSTFFRKYERCELEDCDSTFIDQEQYDEFKEDPDWQHNYGGSGFINKGAIKAECLLAKQAYDDKPAKRKTVKFEFPPHDGHSSFRDIIRDELESYGLKYGTGRISPIDKKKPKIRQEYIRYWVANYIFGFGERIGLHIDIKYNNSKISQANTIRLAQHLNITTSDIIKCNHGENDPAVDLDQEHSNLEVDYFLEWWHRSTLQLRLMKEQDCDFDKVVFPEVTVDEVVV